MTNAATATKNLAEMLTAKVAEAIANGATEAQAIAAVRLLWLEVAGAPVACSVCGVDIDPEGAMARSLNGEDAHVGCARAELAEAKAPGSWNEWA